MFDFKNFLKMPTEVIRSYTIAFTMRSGSNELCSLLACNGFGVPGELFRDPLPGMPNLAKYGAVTVVYSGGRI